MRLIDADAFVELLNEELYSKEDLLYPSEAKDWMLGNNSGIREAIRIVKRMPTVEPVRRGHWVNLFDGRKLEFKYYECSVCGISQRREYNYCPMCGTKMMEDESADTE